MKTENRVDIRYKEIGHVTAPELCALPGILDDISESGCKIHYAFPVVVELENEYELKILPSQQQDEPPLKLICVPQWVNETDGSTFIGFKIQYSPDDVRLKEFISYLKERSESDFPEIK
jgi:hypothetical protein